MITFIKGLNLQNTSTSQAIARIWHSARPRKVGTLIWLTLNQGLPIGSWVQLMGIPPQYKVCNLGAEETLSIASSNAPWLSAPGKLTSESGSNGKPPSTSRPPGPLCSLVKPLGSTKTTPRGYTYLRQPLDILRNFIIYHL